MTNVMRTTNRTGGSTFWTRRCRTARRARYVGTSSFIAGGAGSATVSAAGGAVLRGRGSYRPARIACPAPPPTSAR